MQVFQTNFTFLLHARGTIATISIVRRTPITFKEVFPTNQWDYSLKNLSLFYSQSQLSFRATVKGQLNLYLIFQIWGRRFIGISGSLIWSKTLMELMFNPCGELRWSPEGPVSQIHSPHLLVGASEIFSDLLRSVQMLKREWGAESNGKLPHLFMPSKTAQPWILSLRWKTCLRQNFSLGFSACSEGPAFGQNIHDDEIAIG